MMIETIITINNKNNIDYFDKFLIIQKNLLMESIQVESSALSSILRILLRYVMEVKSTDVKGFTKSQLTAYINTLQAQNEYKYNVLKI